MKSFVKMLAIFGFLVFATGCISFNATPIVSTIQVNPSEMAQSTLLGTECGSTWIFGGEGQLGIQKILKANPGKKITFVDYSFSWRFFSGDVCMAVYGY